MRFSAKHYLQMWDAGVYAYLDTSSYNVALQVLVSTAVTSATYDASTGVLSVTGADRTSGAAVDITKLSVTGSGGASYTLADTNTVTASSSTAFSVTLDATDKINVNGLLNQNGTSSVGGTTFNLAAEASWMSGANADATGNGCDDGEQRTNAFH